MKRNLLVQRIAKLTDFKRGVFVRFLAPTREEHADLFGKYRFKMDLSMGFLQKIYFLKPDIYEIETQQALRSLIKPGMTVFDIGANTGFLTLLMADLVGEKGHVYSFEPFSGNYKMLESNVAQNGLKQAHVYRMALSDIAGEATLNLNPVNDGGHSLGDFSKNPDLAGRAQLKETVKTERLDDFITSHNIQKVDLIKIDVEGGEIKVFEGAKSLLSSPEAPAILCEVGTEAQAQFGKTEADLRNLLYGYGYKSYWLGRERRELLKNEPVKGLINILFKKQA